MGIPHSERKQIENEMIFRRMNEKVGDELGELDAMYIEDHNPQLIRDEAGLLYFKCECSDENCEERIAITLENFQTIHTDRDTFIVMPDHEVDLIEKVILITDTYSVVKKNNSTAEPGKELNNTAVNNS